MTEQKIQYRLAFFARHIDDTGRKAGIHVKRFAAGYGMVRTRGCSTGGVRERCSAVSGGRSLR
jgi:hypothetical protein